MLEELLWRQIARLPPIEDRLGDIRREIAEADEAREVGSADTFPLGECSKGDAFALGECRVEPARDFGATRIVWVTRKAHIETAYGSEDDGSLLVTGDHDGGERTLPAAEMIVATGFRPDLSLLREIRLTLDPWLESSGTIGPLIDPNLHTCGTVRPHGAQELAHAEPNFFIIGMKSYGRAPTFLLATGYEQARSVVAYLAGDVEAAERVELELPETGVCVSRTIGQPAESKFARLEKRLDQPRKPQRAKSVRPPRSRATSALTGDARR